jgi:hypothetical protein
VNDIPPLGKDRESQYTKFSLLISKLRQTMSLKDALKKAGFKSSKSQNERDVKPTKKETKEEVHQKARNYCEVCELIQPDVERFKHNNPTIDAEWICAACADKEMIHDDFRMTHQSEFAIKKRYRREFGPTKDFSSYIKKNPKVNRNASGNTASKKVEKPKNFDEDGEENFNC